LVPRTVTGLLTRPVGTHAGIKASTKASNKAATKISTKTSTMGGTRAGTKAGTMACIKAFSRGVSEAGTKCVTEASTKGGTDYRVQYQDRHPPHTIFTDDPALLVIHIVIFTIFHIQNSRYEVSLSASVIKSQQITQYNYRENWL
jgi:hypothetical protein